MEREVGGKREREEKWREEERKDESESAEIIVHQRCAHESPVGIRAHPLFVAYQLKLVLLITRRRCGARDAC